jgi:ABC-2 type transport system permease protein
MRLGSLLLCVVGALSAAVWLETGWSGLIESSATLFWLVLAYALFWSGVGILASVGRRHSAVNALIVGSLWLLLLIVFPQCLALAVAGISPAADIDDVRAGLREAHANTISRSDDLLAAYGRRYPGYDPKAGSSVDRAFQEYVVALDAAAQQTKKSVRELEARSMAREALARNAAYTMPPLAFQAALDRVSGNDEGRYSQFAAQTRAFHGQFKEALLAPMFEVRAITLEEFDGLPRFRFAEDAGGLLRRVAGSGMVLTIAAALAMAAAWCGLGPSTRL